MPAPVIAAAGLTALAGLFGGLMQQRAAEEQQRQAEKAQREKDARDRLAQAQHDQLGIIQNMGQGEQGALNQLMAVLARTQR